MSRKEYLPKVALALHAHPDDQDFSVAGTLALWAKRDCQVISVIVTSGEAGFNDPSHATSTKAELAQLRQAEQTAANAILGVSETIFLNYPDGELEPTLDLRRDITRLLRRYKPQALLIGDPDRVFFGDGYINHPDHRAAAQAALFAAFPSTGTRLIFPELLAEGLPPHDLERLYIHGTEKPDTWVDITSTIDLKITALRQHASQLGDWDPTKVIRKWAANEGWKRFMRYAEIYKVMRLS